MEVPGENLSYFAQWVGLIATLGGTALGGVSVVWAMIAAIQAKGAREQAEMARRAAIRLGRIAQLGDLIGDTHELQAMLARSDFPSIAGKANLLRGRIARFKTEAYTELTPQEAENLDVARGQLEVVAVVAATSKARPEYRVGQIQLGFGKAYEALNRVVGMQGAQVEGERR